MKHIGSRSVVRCRKVFQFFKVELVLANLSQCTSQYRLANTALDIIRMLVYLFRYNWGDRPRKGYKFNIQ